MKLQRRGRIAIAIAALLLVAIFVPPSINVGRYRSRIATSISNAVGRPTTIDSISLRLLPQPGFDLSGVSIADDPAFGPEPMLHAEQVTATLRLTSLWRGRFEIAKLSLQYPSLNLVRAADGRWNIESLLEHASRIPTAPTTKARPETRPRFPYIEADAGRINFKLGQEKLVYSLADADFALWLASEDEARTRLAARMVRTDSYLSDTGTVEFEGRFQRAWNLRDTPMSVSASIDNAQLGQLTKLIDGLDRGWRGAVDADISMTGTPSELKILARAGVNDFRRYDIISLDRVRLESRCTAVYSAPTAQLSNIDCRAPMSDGVVSVRGNASGGLDLRSYDLAVTADKVPLQQVVSLLRHAKKGVPEDLSASGSVSGTLSFRRTAPEAGPEWTGSGSTTETIVRSSVLTPHLVLKPVQFKIQAPQPTRTRVSNTAPKITIATGDYHLAFDPVAVDAGAATPTTVSGWISRTGYNFSVIGDSDIPRALQFAQIVGLPASPVNATGTAKLSMSVAGEWAGLRAPKPLGTAQVRDVTVRMKGIAAPLKVASATIALGENSLNVSNVSGSFADTHLTLTGSAQIPRQCEAIESCPVQFDLRADQVSTDELNRLLNPRVARRPWYAILGSRPEPSILNSLNATGTVTVGRLNVKSMIAAHVLAKARLQAGKLALTDVQADLWGGKHHGEWTADFSGNEPVYSGSGTINSASVPQLASLMKDNLATGTVTATYSALMRGYTAGDLASSAAGDVSFDWRKGTLQRVSLNGSNAPLSFSRFAGALTLRDGTLTLAPVSKLASQTSIYQVTGTASLGRQLDVKLRNGAHAYSVTGTIDSPKVITALQQETQASISQ